MLSSVGIWAGAYAEALLDDLAPLRTAYTINDQSPLGSAASFGVPFDIDRQYVADQLGFAKVQNNVLYAQHGRGKFEGLVVQALAQVMVDLSKLAQDVLLFTTSECDFFHVAPELCTGSSIMPQKHNLGALELVRGRTHALLGYQATILGIVAGLPSGYNMDNQETKKPFIAALDLTAETLQVCTLFVQGLEPNEARLRAACSPELFATDQAYAMVRAGVPFRDAYRQVAAALDSLAPMDPVEQLRTRTHLGAAGNLGLEAARARLGEARAALDERRTRLERVTTELLASARAGAVA
jgi:argininosuccinate lyase